MHQKWGIDNESTLIQRLKNLKEDNEKYNDELELLNQDLNKVRKKKTSTNEQLNEQDKKVAALKSEINKNKLLVSQINDINIYCDGLNYCLAKNKELKEKNKFINQWGNIVEEYTKIDQSKISSYAKIDDDIKSLKNGVNNLNFKINELTKECDERNLNRNMLDSIITKITGKQEKMIILFQ